MHACPCPGLLVRQPALVAGQPILRGLGWDMESPFSGNRGELYPVGSFGHTGFTGTSIWMDPSTKSYVIILTNYVHPKRGKSLTSLRGRIATITAAALGIDTPGLVLIKVEAQRLHWWNGEDDGELVL